MAEHAEPRLPFADTVGSQLLRMKEDELSRAWLPNLPAVTKGIRDLLEQSQFIVDMGWGTSLRLSIQRLLEAIEKILDTTDKLMEEHETDVSEELKDAIKSNGEINERTRDLVDDLAGLLRLVKMLKSRRVRVPTFLLGVLGLKNRAHDNNMLLLDIVIKSDKVMSSFENRNGKGVMEVICSIRDAKEMQQRH